MCIPFGMACLKRLSQKDRLKTYETPSSQRTAEVITKGQLIGVLLKVDLVQMIANVYFTIKDSTATLTRTVCRLEIKGSGRGCMDHESLVEFPYIHESRYL